MNRSEEDAHARDAQNAVDGLIDIIKDLKAELRESAAQLTMRNDLITELNERIHELETQAAETITATITNE